MPYNAPMPHLGSTLDHEPNYQSLHRHHTSKPHRNVNIENV
jgi:hypothetical protein